MTPANKVFRGARGPFGEIFRGLSVVVAYSYEQAPESGVGSYCNLFVAPRARHSPNHFGDRNGCATIGRGYIDGTLSSDVQYNDIRENGQQTVSL